MPADRVQMNVRVPRDLQTRVDDRRAKITEETGDPISRDEWVTRALHFALTVAERPRTQLRGQISRTRRGRTLDATRRPL